MAETDELLTPDQYGAFKHWMVATEYLEAYLNRVLAVYGLSMTEYRMLVVLNDAPAKRLRMSDLASDARHSLSRSSHTIARMEARGWVQRVPHDGDRRVIYVTLTAEGIELFRQATPPYHAAIRRVFVQAVGDDQIETLESVVQRIITATTVILR